MFYNMSFCAWLTNGWYYTRFYFKVWFTKYFKNLSKNDLNKDGYTLQFSDDFDGPIDWNKWSWHENWGNVRDQVIFKQEQDIQSNSDLVLTSDVNNVTGEPLAKSGGLYTWTSLNTKYGYFETREKLSPKGLTYWPAFWLAGSDTWPPEIDIFELMAAGDSSFFTMTLHWRNTWTNDKQIQAICEQIYQTFGYRPTDYYDALNYLKQDPWTQQKQDYMNQLISLTKTEMKGRRLGFCGSDFLSKEYHTYACEWTEKKIIWYIDNLAVYVLDKHVPNMNMYVLINNNYTYDSTHGPVSSQLPMSLYCDYFRYYK